MPVSIKQIKIYTCEKCGHEEILTDSTDLSKMSIESAALSLVKSPLHSATTTIVNYTWMDGPTKPCSCGGVLSKCMQPLTNGHVGTSIDYKCTNPECQEHPMFGKQVA